MSPVDQQTLLTNEHVSIELKLPENISRDKFGELIFYFNPIEGIHINTIPIIELRLGKNSAVKVVGNPRFRKNDNEYLDSTKPIIFTIQVKKGSTTGKQKIKGSLNYFYCSDKEGWCNRFSQPIDLTIEIIQ
jgi:hypothetical protein